MTLRPEDVVLEEGDGAGVLHRAGVELGHEQLVVLAERVRAVELLLEEVEALLGDVEDRRRRPGTRPSERRQKTPSGMPAVLVCATRVVRAGDSAVM